MGLLDALRIYNPGKWNVLSRDKMSNDEIAEYKSAEVVASDFGHSVMLTMHDGMRKYIPVSTTSKDVHVGDSVNLKDATVVTLGRPGDKDIQRLEI